MGHNYCHCLCAPSCVNIVIICEDSPANPPQLLNNIINNLNVLARHSHNKHLIIRKIQKQEKYFIPYCKNQKKVYFCSLKIE